MLVAQRSQALALLERRGMARLAGCNAAGITAATVSWPFTGSPTTWRPRSGLLSGAKTGPFV